MRIKDEIFCFAHLRWCHNGWASNILIVVDTGVDAKWWTVHYKEMFCKWLKLNLIKVYHMVKTLKAVNWSFISKWQSTRWKNLTYQLESGPLGRPVLMYWKSFIQNKDRTNKQTKKWHQVHHCTTYVIILLQSNSAAFVIKIAAWW